MIENVIQKFNVENVLDYGCGKGELVCSVPTYYYDPCMPAFADGNSKARDMVVCVDVMEHVEKDCIDFVLADIKRCMKKCAFMSISVVPAKSILPDGRNAHITLEHPMWWLRRVLDCGFMLDAYTNIETHCVMVVS